MKMFLCVMLLLQTVQWEWVKPSEVLTRDTYVLRQVEADHRCWVSTTWFEDRMIEIRCPQPFSPYGVSWSKWCVVHEDETLKRAKVRVVKGEASPKHRDELLSCEVEKKR